MRDPGVLPPPVAANLSRCPRATTLLPDAAHDRSDQKSALRVVRVRRVRPGLLIQATPILYRTYVEREVCSKQSFDPSLERWVALVGWGLLQVVVEGGHHQ